MQWMVRLVRWVLWGFLVYGVALGSKVVLIALLGVIMFAIELLICTTPAVLPASRDRARHRKGSDGPQA